MTFWHRLFGPSRPTLRQVMACEDAVAGLESRIDLFYADLKKLRGYVYSTERKRLSEPVEATNGEEPTPDIAPAPQARPAASTAHLARRFKA